MKINSETIEELSAAEIFQLLETFLNKGLEKTEKKYGEEIASFTRAMIQGSIVSIHVNAERFQVNGPKALLAFIETIGQWDKAVDTWQQQRAQARFN